MKQVLPFYREKAEVCTWILHFLRARREHPPALCLFGNILPFWSHTSFVSRQEK
jgi:hypothetical protein